MSSPVADAPETRTASAAQAQTHTHHQTVVVRSYEAHEAHEMRETRETTHIAHAIHGMYEAGDTRHVEESSDSQGSLDSHETHTIVTDVSAHIVIEHTHEANGANGANARETLADSASGVSAPRTRMSRFYAPGLRFRPDESWVEQVPPSGVPAELEYPAPPARMQTPAPVGEYVEYTEHVEHPRPRDELGRLIESLHALFEHDRSVASQTGATRCGVCYLHFPVAELEYREDEGFYICPSCRRNLGGGRIPMVRRQQT